MAEKNPGSGSPFNLTTVIALLTVAGGMWVVSQNPTSSRPTSPDGLPSESTGDQAVRARLWEDPLDEKNWRAQATNEMAFELLRQQTVARLSGTNPPPLLLPVMIHGGPYTEDQESRIRTRYATISALGEAGYVPEDAEHVGTLEIPWPTPTALSGWLKKPNALLRLVTGTNVPANVPACESSVSIAFEWYRSRVFNKGNQPSPEKRVLVLWLEEEQFTDFPHARLALLLNELANTNSFCTNFAQMNVCLTNYYFCGVHLVGPRTSATLRGFLPSFTAGAFDPSVTARSLLADVSNVLHQVDVFCPTPRVMDAMLVTNSADDKPRHETARALTNYWFHTFHNFAATDAQLAREAFEELKLRQVDLGKTNVNLVLVSEWDTFYGRALALTYAAELAKFQQVSNKPSNTTFVRQFLAGSNVWPQNLICETYLRGLDGQTTKPKATPSKSDGSRKPTIEQLVDGDVNESPAEGEPQFDYMIRLGDRLLERQRQMRAAGQGKFEAIGICGSDSYDTLVILQVLRRRFPDTVFFTTDLDARFAHPKEQDWARNLVVLSGYGLELNINFQGGIAPFRDSDQTAYFAATLAALDAACFDKLGEITVPPRRFEIGRDGIYDLSVNPPGPLQAPPEGHVQFLQQPEKKTKLAIVIVCGLFLVFLTWRVVQRLTTDCTQFENAALWFRQEDVGGRDGAASLMRRLRQLGCYAQSPDPGAVWLWREFEKVVENFDKEGVQTELHSEQMQKLMDHLNDDVLQSKINFNAIASSKLIAEKTLEDIRQMHRENQSQGVFEKSLSTRRMRLHRRLLDELFDVILTPQAEEKLEDAEQVELKALATATRFARRAGEEQFRLRRYQRRWAWAGALVLLVVLWVMLCTASDDSQPFKAGEPFLFTAGISVWPTEFFRLFALALSVILIFRSYAMLRGGIFEITRNFRLPLMTYPAKKILWRLPSIPPPAAAVDVNWLWEHYQQLGRPWHCFRRIAPMFLLYFCFCMAIVKLFDSFPYTPLRGGAVLPWNYILLYTSVSAFLILAFWMIDAACLCRWLVERLGESPTVYPKACLQHFIRQRGLRQSTAAEDKQKIEKKFARKISCVLPEQSEQLRQLEAEKEAAIKEAALARSQNNRRNEDILAEWIDMQIIAELTARVGRLVYLPFIVFFVTIVSRNSLFDRWTWPPALVAIFILNLCLCAASMLILRQSAFKAREAGLATLKARVEETEKENTPDPKARQASVAKKLLDELETLDKGAFAPIWESPLLGAILIPSTGTVLLELLPYLFK